METKNCQNCKKDFVIEEDDFSFYEKIKVPPPTFCPMCRAERRFAFRNDKRLFRVKDAFNGKDIFSLYPPESNRKVITQEEWHSDDWDAIDFGRDYDFSRNFFEQFLELEKDVPIYNLNVKTMVNSPYSGNASDLKNCYLCFNSNQSEDCLYGTANDKSKTCVDCSHVTSCERCYESFWLQNCYQCYFTIMSSDSRNLWFSRDCVGCSDCFGCANLRKASHCIFNQQYTKEGYEAELEKMELNTIKGLEKSGIKAREFWNTQPIKYHQGLKNLNSTGSYVTNSKNVKDSYLVREGENLRYCQYMQVPSNKECYDTSVWGQGMELHYETCICGEGSYNLKFCFNCWPNCKDIEYSMNLYNSSDCFGCVGLKKKQYCILNKQYTKEEYTMLVERIKKQMAEIPYIDQAGRIYKYGEFFPIEFSPFGYNNTIAFQHFINNKEEVEKNKYPWIEVEKGKYSITRRIGEAPNSIREVTDDVLKEVFECSECRSPYKIAENEYIFLKNEKLPLPTMCIDCRYYRRITDRLKVQLYDRPCMCLGESDLNKKYKNTVSHTHGHDSCEERFKTGYPIEGDYIVYCEKCYQQEVY